MRNQSKEFVFVTNHCCVAVLKVCYVLKKLGWKIWLITRGPYYGILSQNNLKYLEIFEVVNFCKTQEQFETAIELAGRKVKKFVVRTEPYWTIPIIKSLVKDSKVIIFMMESAYWRDEIESCEVEDIAVEMADAFIFHSREAREELSLHRPINLMECIVPLAVPYDWYKFNPKMEGGLASQGGHSDLDDWRDYRELYKKLRKYEIDIYAYSPFFVQKQSDDPNCWRMTGEYSKLCKSLRNAEYDQLIGNLGAHYWNLIGNWKSNKKDRVWDYAGLNKLWDAIAGGVPSVVFNSKTSEKIIKDYDIGIICEKPYDLSSLWHLHKEKRKNLLYVRKELSMENFIQPMINLLGELDA